MINIKSAGKKEKRLLIILGIALGISFYFQSIYKPLAGKITSYKFQIEKSKARLNELLLKIPAIDRQRQNIVSLNAEYENTLEQINDIEKKLPSKDATSQLLNELIRLAKDLKIISARQKMESLDEYSKIYIELRFAADYKNTINYIKRIESISPFLVIEELDISQPKERKEEVAGGMPARLIISSLLGDIPTAEKIKAVEEAGTVGIARDIFVSKSKPVLPAKKMDLKVEGITYSPQGSTAIIKGDVVKVGSKIEHLTVKTITSDGVILTDGIEDTELKIER